jgi:hypothetical protein
MERSEYLANLKLASGPVVASVHRQHALYRVGRPVFYRPSPASVARRVFEDFVRWVAGF